VDVPYETHGPAKLSRDRQYFAAPIEGLGTFSPKALTLFTREGKLIDASDEDVQSFDWLADNRLIYAVGQAIYMTQSGSAKGSEILTFPDNAGQPAQFAVSPDGSQLAFTLETDANFVAIYGTTWILNLDGNNLRQLTNSPGPNDPGITSDDPKINFPTWSPDGRWIAVVEGRVAVSGGLPGGNPNRNAQGRLYVVPSDDENVMLTEDEAATSAVLIYSYFDGTKDYVKNPDLLS
jgi:Tol biopolymer transport system component